MKKPRSFFKISSLVLFFVFNINLMIGSVLVDQMPQQVVAIDYCHFLNQVAAADPYHLYDEAMSSDPDRASILRFGQPGKYFYEVVAGRDNFPISYVSPRAEARYCHWMQNGFLAREQGVISFEQENCCEDYFLRSNRVDFFASMSLGAPILTLSLDDFHISPDTKYQLESTAIKIVIVASLCFSGYKIIKGWNAARIEQRTPIPLAIKRMDQVIPPALGGTMIKHLPTTLQETDISLMQFHKREAESTENPNIKSFHTYCIAANEMARALETTATEWYQTSQKLDQAHDQASAALYRYGAVYVVSKIGCLCLDTFVPGLSILAHASTELIGSTHCVVTRVVDYGASTAQSGTINKFIIRPTVVGEEHPASSQSWVEWTLGKDLGEVTKSINQINETSRESLEPPPDMLKKIEEYKDAMLSVDAAYEAAVKEKRTADSKEMKSLDWWDLSVMSGKNLKNIFRKNSLQAESDIPVGGFRHVKGKEEKNYNVYYRVYAKPTDDSREDPALTIGAHLLDNTIPDIASNTGILIQEVHVPIGTRLQKLNLTVSPNSQSPCNQYRLLDVIPEDCFKEGKPLTLRQTTFVP